MPQTFDSGTDHAWEIKQCPYTFIDADTVRLLESSRDAEKGHLPASGGMHDQTAVFVHADRLIRRERAAYRKTAANG